MGRVSILAAVIPAENPRMSIHNAIDFGMPGLPLMSFSILKGEYCVGKKQLLYGGTFLFVGSRDLGVIGQL